ncbi:MAG: FkbM family methyltransferase [Fibromonadales bacterium]|nr:FkbM family methyltransferase [Fibromonadales bacterium]
MEKAIVFGIGQIYKTCADMIRSKFDIVGLIDNDKNKQGQIIDGFKIESPEFLLKGNIAYDKILLIPQVKLTILNQLISLGISMEKIDWCYFNGTICIPQKEFIHDKLVLRENGVKLIIETDGDEILFEDTIIRKSYEVSLNDNSQYVVINIGGNVGDTALYFASFENIVKIYAYEPFKNTFNRALENLKLNQNLANKIEYHNFAIGNRNEELFLDDVDSIGASIINPKKGTTKIIVRDVAEILNELFSKHNEEIFLELDCEGSEFEILSKLESENMLDKISIIAMECHYMNINVPEKREFLKKLLKKNGFMFKLFHFRYGHDLLYAFNFKNEKLGE